MKAKNWFPSDTIDLKTTALAAALALLGATADLAEASDRIDFTPVLPAKRALTVDAHSQTSKRKLWALLRERWQRNVVRCAPLQEELLASGGRSIMSTACSGGSGARASCRGASRRSPRFLRRRARPEVHFYFAKNLRQKFVNLIYSKAFPPKPITKPVMRKQPGNTPMVPDKPTTPRQPGAI